MKIRPLHFPIREDEAAFQESADSTIKRIKDRDPDDGKGITPLAAAQPFSVGAEAEALGVERSRTRKDDLKAHAPQAQRGMECREASPPGLAWPGSTEA